MCKWFELILYAEEELINERRIRNMNREFEDLAELTLESDDEDAVGAISYRNNLRRVPKLRTYSFKKPQFMKKLTNTYFTKSKASEKAHILHK